jgi:hypothetical protein
MASADLDALFNAIHRDAIDGKRSSPADSPLGGERHRRGR